MKKILSILFGLMVVCTSAIAKSPYDKEAHFGLSFVGQTVGYGLLRELGCSDTTAIVLSTVGMVGIGFLKEVRDMHIRGDGRIDMGDMGANMLGIGAAVLTIKVFDF